MPEALERWPINIFRELLPRLYMIIDTVDLRYRNSFPHDRDNWQDLLQQTAILWDGQVRMANLSAFIDDLKESFYGTGGTKIIQI